MTANPKDRFKQCLALQNLILWYNSTQSQRPFNKPSIKWCIIAGLMPLRPTVQKLWGRISNLETDNSKVKAREVAETSPLSTRHLNTPRFFHISNATLKQTLNHCDKEILSSFESSHMAATFTTYLPSSASNKQKNTISFTSKHASVSLRFWQDRSFAP
jgi:hypothetical protein